MGIKYIHVHQQKIRQNLKDGQNRPVITIKDKSENQYAHEANIYCPCCNSLAAQVIYSGPGQVKPLIPCGARVVIITDGVVEAILDEDIQS